MARSSKRDRIDGYTEEWRNQIKDAIIREVENGCPEEEAARRSGVHQQSHWRWRNSDRNYNNRIIAARKRSERRVQRLIIALMREGENFTQSCKDAGSQPVTVMMWRLKDEKFNERVVKLMKKQRRKRDRDKVRANKERKAAQHPLSQLFALRTIRKRKAAPLFFLCGRDARAPRLRP